MTDRQIRGEHAGRPPVATAGLRALTRSADVLALALMLAFGLGYLLLALRLPFGTLQAPSSGMFPRIIAVLTIVSAVLSLFFRLVRHKLVSGGLDEDDDPEEREFGEAFWRVPALIACLALYVGFAPVAGHIITSSVVSFLVLLMLASRPRWQMAALSIGFAVATHLLFRVLLDVPLPAGRWLP